MRIFIVGASGYIGSAIGRALVRHGHGVAGAARGPETERKLRDAGVDAVTCDVTNPVSLSAPARSFDGVVYAVQYNGENSAGVEGSALGTLVDALAGSSKPFIYTSGAWVYGNTGERAADEDAVLDPTPLVAQRPQLERTVLDGVARGVRAVVIRPGDVYGFAGGLPAMWVDSAKETGTARFVGDGTNHWPTVEVDDLAELFVSALERAQAGAVYNAADATSFTVREMAQAASYGAGRDGAVASWPLDEARQTLGPFADALALDQRINSRRAREELGWRPRSTTIVDDLRTGSYARA